MRNKVIISVLSVCLLLGIAFVSKAAMDPTFISMESLLNKVFDSTNNAIKVKALSGITLAGDLEMGDTPYSIDGGTKGITFDSDNDDTVEMTITNGGELNGDVLNDQFAYQSAGDIFDEVGSGKLLFAWTTPATSETDLTNNSNTGTYQGSMTTGDQVAKGLVWTLDFDGTDDAVTIADTSDLTFGDGSNDSPMTIGFWVEIIDSATFEYPICKYDLNGQREWFVSVDASEKVVFNIYDESVDKLSSRTIDTGLSAGWHFVVITYDGTGGATALDGTNCVIYADGVAVASTANSDGSYVAMEDLTSNASIGAYYNTTLTGHASFDIGLVFVTAEELSAANIWNLYIKTRGYYNL